jgi:hypothetical protein
MNEKLDSLEAELAAMQPRQVSATLERRIAAELEASPRRSQRILPIAVATSAIAASLFVAFCFWPSGETARVESPSPVQPALTAAFDPALPSVWSFRAATVQGAGDLDSVLDQHSAPAPPEPAHYVQIRGFGVSETNRQSIFGEL